MPRYDYKCKECTIQDYIDSDLPLVQVPVPKTTDFDQITSMAFVFEAQHGMAEKPTIKCPICGKKSERSWNTERKSVYVRGNWALDRAGCKLEQERCKLQEDDPYGHMRQPGEADDLDKKLEKIGRKLQNKKYGINTVEMIGWDEKERYIAKLKQKALEKRAKDNV